MSLIDPMKRGEYRTSTKVYAIAVFIGYLTFAFSIMMLWTIFLTQMEETAEETQGMIEETGEENHVSVIQGDYIDEIKLVYALSLICFGLLDCIFALILWRGKAPKDEEVTARVLAEGYISIRGFSILVITTISITILIRSDSRFFMNILYLVIPIFSVISLVFLLYFHRKFFGEKTEEETVFKIPDETAF